jgi:hypothetical protein
MTDLVQKSEGWAEVLRHQLDYVKPACMSSLNFHPLKSAFAQHKIVVPTNNSKVWRKTATDTSSRRSTTICRVIGTGNSRSGAVQ